jgi:peptide/nickel transport system substrate-binding protein
MTQKSDEMSDDGAQRASGVFGRLQRRRVLQFSAAAALGPILAACGSSNNKNTSNNAANNAAKPSAAASQAAPSAAASSAATAAKPAGSPAAGSSPATSNAPAKPSSGQAVIMQGADITYLDPSFRNSVPEANVTFHIFDSFMRRNAQTQAADPWIITSYSAKDPLTWTLKIRTDAKFHDGTPVDAAAVAFSLTRIAKKQIGSKPAIPSFGIQTSFVSATAVDANTVEMKTQNPVAADFLGQQFCGYEVVPPSVYTDESDANLAKVQTNPVGSGPYKFVEWVKDDHLTMTATDNWWGGPVAYKTLLWKPVPASDTRILALQKGDADIIVNIPPDSVDDVKKFADVISIQGGRDIFIGIRTDQKPFDDVRVRQALNYGFNFDAANKGLLNGVGKRMATVINGPNTPSDAQPYAYDFNKAKQLLSDAGLANGFSVKMDSPNGRYIKDKELAQAFVSDMSKLNIKIDLAVLDFALYAGQMLQKRQPDTLFFLGLGSTFDGQDELNYLNPDFALNSTYWVDDKWVTEFKQLLQTTDTAQRKTMMADLSKEMFDQAPWVFVWKQVDNYGKSKKINWAPRADESIFLHEAKPAG